MINLIIETDCGHDPDDFFTLCYLHEVGVNIRAILVAPGDPDQIAAVRMFCGEVGLNIPVGAAKLGRTQKRSQNNMHTQLLKRYGYCQEAEADDLGTSIIPKVLKEYPDSEGFIIGPCSSIGRYCGSNPDRDHPFEKATMQGGFLSYDQYRPQMFQALPQFEGKTWVPTFNLNADRPGGTSFLSADIPDRRMCGKNVCHSVVFDKNQAALMKPGKTRASELFIEAAAVYLDKHDGKKFHDPVAAVCHLHPEVGTWYRGNTMKMESGWGTVENPTGDHILADLDHHTFWELLSNWK